MGMKFPLFAIFAATLLTGCVTTAPNAEFVGSVNFSSLDTFSYKHTLITGMGFRESDEYLIEEMSKTVIGRELSHRGFTQVDSDGDFFVVVKWRKAVSGYPSMHDSIDGPHDALRRRDNPSFQLAPRLHMTLEIYESGTDHLFWRNELPNIFDALQLTEGRLNVSLERAIKNFPQRIEKDPNLPSIE